ncbi:modulator of macroautophagy TMEM150B isoform X2 [Tachyglossus aculeatus]|uniref:modulator of macroautophagy TMEM150B isoform X2 n=1 Tax=Tachyglossus aculeatus TaxID=9261 RepID=UPI0018F52263|nr:modulator of macroautophagy TMEM150B isoform X2 [Tachyglossus aculeatus]
MWGRWALLPAFLAAWATVGVWTVFALAVSNNSVNLTRVFPYISHCGSFPPQSCIFSQILNLGAAMAATICLLRYHQLQDWGAPPSWNQVSLGAGLLSALGTSIVGNFQLFLAAAVPGSEGEVSTPARGALDQPPPRGALRLLLRPHGGHGGAALLAPALGRGGLRVGRGHDPLPPVRPLCRGLCPAGQLLPAAPGGLPAPHPISGRPPAFHPDPAALGGAGCSGPGSGALRAGPVA